MIKIWLKHTLFLFLANGDTAELLVTHVRLHTPMSTDLGSSYSTHLYQKGTPTTETPPTTALFRLFLGSPSYSNTVDFYIRPIVSFTLFASRLLFNLVQWTVNQAYSLWFLTRVEADSSQQKRTKQ